MLSRTLGSVSVDINTHEANEIYLDESCAKRISDNNIGEILEAIYKENDCDHMPLSLFIELTDTCNFSCPFCYINEKGKKHNFLPSFSVLKPTIDYLIKKGLFYCVLTGGECLICPDFSLLYRYLKESGVLVTVFTNGYLLDDNLIQLFNQYKPFKVEISIYGSDDSSYNTATAQKNIDSSRIFSNILKLKQHGINVICKTLINTLTESSVPYIEEWCKKNNIPYYTGIELMKSYSGANKDSYLASEAIRNQIKEKNNEKFFADEKSLQTAYSDKVFRYNFDCIAGKTDIMIDSQFNLLPCMQASWIDEWKFSIPELGIETAYDQLVRKIMQYKGTKLKYCKGCIHNQVCQECFMTQYEYSDLKYHRLQYCKTLKDFMAEFKTKNI